MSNVVYSNHVYSNHVFTSPVQWILITGGCSGRGCSGLVQYYIVKQDITPYKSLHPVSTAPTFAERRNKDFWISEVLTQAESYFQGAEFPGPCKKTLLRPSSGNKITPGNNIHVYISLSLYIYIYRYRYICTYIYIYIYRQIDNTMQIR